VANALVRRTLDWETQYTYAYSKIVGLQNSGPWVLKKDYFELEANVQIYEIPAGREINELLWYSPAEQNNLYLTLGHLVRLVGPVLVVLVDTLNLVGVVVDTLCSHHMMQLHVCKT
jgi:hypothetical protein